MRSTNIVGFLLLLLSMGIAGSAAYFSITGLAELFAAALIPVIIMASILEAGKLGATFFLHRYWHELPAWKYLLTLMVAVLMIITSMGIFGFLSKGHLEQEQPLANLELQSERIDERIVVLEEQIARQEAGIDDANDTIAQLDEIVQTLIDFDRIRGADGANATRQSQQPQRDALDEQINTSFDRIEEIRTQIDELNAEKTDLRSSQLEVEAKLGPVIYVAELFGFDLEGDGKGQAVRVVIVMVMIAFDPLAIILIMAADWSFLKDTREQRLLREARERKEREEEEEKERKAEEKREAARIKKEEKDAEARAKREAAAARKEAREREKEMEALELENEAKRLDLERKRIENEKLRLEGTMPSYAVVSPEKDPEDEIEEEPEIVVNDDATVDVIVDDAELMVAESTADDESTTEYSEPEPKESVQEPEEEQGADSLVEDLPETVIEPESTVKYNNEQLVEEIDSLVQKGYFTTGQWESLRTDVGLESDTMDKAIHEVISEMASNAPKEVWDNVPTDLAENHDKYIYDNSEVEEADKEETKIYTNSDDPELWEDVAQLIEKTHTRDEPIIPQLEAEYESLDEDEDKEVDPLAFIGQAFDDDEQLIRYLILNEDVFNELLKLRDETKDEKIREGIDRVIDAVYEAKKTNTKGWL